MKIAVVADIHANAVALDAVLADMERASDRPDHIVCLGDLPALNPQPREVMARIRALGCPTVRGNVDDRIPRHLADPEAALAFRSSVAPLTDDAARRLRDIEFWCAAQLTEDDRTWLLDLPLALDVPLGDGATLCCYHGSPRSNMDAFFPTTPDVRLDEWFAGSDAAVCVGGHTHAQMVRRYRDRTYVNVGSVGRAVVREPGKPIRNAPWAEYGILTWEGGGLSVDLRRIPFDLDALIAATYASGMPHPEWWEAEWRRPA